MGQIPEVRRGIVTNHDALGYFIDEYGLRFVGSVFPNLDVSADPSPRDLAELIETIQREGVVAIFSEPAVNQSWRRRSQRRPAPISWSSRCTPIRSGRPDRGVDTLDGMLLHDAQVIHDALAEG
jgi:ABC-type Zn2+ transport system substrate-binding protein/surface adhesin